MEVMLPHQHPHLSFAGTGAEGLKAEIVLQPCLSLCWWCMLTCGLATWEGMLELVWDPNTSAWRCGELVHV